MKLKVSIKKVRILLVGCGKMGEALLDGWLAKGIDTESIYVIEPNRNLEIADKYKVNVGRSVNEIPNLYVPQITVFAVKPQVIDDVETGKAKYDIKLIQKLERKLGIKLTGAEFK